VATVKRHPLMRRNRIFLLRCLSVLPLCLAVSAQVISSNQPMPQGPVSYSSVNQLNGMLSQLEQASQAAQLDLAKLRIDKWKVDSGSKRQTQGNVESVQRNLQAALPEMIADLKASPENLAATFKLYRNLDALYNVFGSVAESTGAFGSKDEFQSLENDLSAFEKARRAFADRMENLAGAKEAEVTRLRAALQTAQASINAEPPKKTVIDDTAPTPAKKPTKKKAAAKPATTPPPAPAPATKPQ
jgi:DNA repair exonuclease SbcCD ATPase subunit